VQLRRLAWFFVGGLVLAAGLWAAALRFSSPLPSEPPRRFDVAVGQDAEAPHRVDYRRLDERLQRLMADPAMVGLAVGVVEDGQIRFIKGYGMTVAGGYSDLEASARTCVARGRRVCGQPRINNAACPNHKDAQ